MAVVQDVFFIPDDIATGLGTGLYQRSGSVIRYATGSNKGCIVKHLDSVNLKTAEQARGMGVKALQFVKRHKKGTIVTAAGAATIGTGLIIYNKVKNSEPIVLTEFRVSLRSYIEAIHKGNMNIDKINDLMKCLVALKEHKDYAKISIQLTAEKIEILVEYIYEYTVKLAKDNDVEIFDENMGILGKSRDTIINLETYLKVQKRIFENIG